MKMTETKRFAEALGSWMHFEACCFRAGLFSESSLKSAIGGVASCLHADHKAARVHADYPLSTIQKVPDADGKRGRGSKRSVDFALLYDNGREPASDPEVLIEGKWAGSSHCSVKNIIGDFIRLSLMKRHYPKATCLFVLAGHSRDFSKVLSRRPFVGGTGDVIRCNNKGSIRKFRYLQDDPDHQRTFGDAIADIHDAKLHVPASFSVSGGVPYPENAKFKAAAWEVVYVDTKNLRPAGWPVSKTKDPGD